MSAWVPSQLARLPQRLLACPRDQPSSAQARATERHRRVALSALMTMLSIGLKLIGSLLSIPLALHYLGPERFGLWMTLISLMALIDFSDLGVGNGLINAIAATHGSDDSMAARAHVSTAFFLLLGFALAVYAILGTVGAFLPWASVFNLSSPIAVAEAGPAVAVLNGCIAGHIVFGAATKIRIGYQEAYRSSLWDALGVVISLGAIILFIRLDLGLPWLVFAACGVPTLSTGGNLASLLLLERRWLLPAWRHCRRASVRELFHYGLLFFTLHMMATITVSSDNLIAIRICGPEAAGLLAVALKLFSPCRLLAGAVLQPLWPAYGEAISRGDIAWVRQTLIRSIALLQLAVLPMAVALVFLGNWLASLWLRQPVHFGDALLIGLAVWVIVEAIGFAVAMFLNGASIIGVQIAMATSCAVLAIAAKLLLAMEFGIAGIVWGTIIAYSATTIAPYGVLVPYRIAALARQRRPGSAVLPTPLGGE